MASRTSRSRAKKLSCLNWMPKYKLCQTCYIGGANGIVNRANVYQAVKSELNKKIHIDVSTTISYYLNVLVLAWIYSRLIRIMRLLDGNVTEHFLFFISRSRDNDNDDKLRHFFILSQVILNCYKVSSFNWQVSS